MIKFNLEFGGFYCSTHDGLINNMIESYFDNDKIDENEVFLSELDDKYDINYKLIQIEYSKKYLEDLEEFISDFYNIDIELKFDSLNSPRFYNFETDKIECNIHSKDAYKLMNHFNDEDCIEWIDEVSSSRDGFTSFYEGYEEVKKDNSILLQYIFKYIHEEFTDDEYLKYYDVNNRYELLHSLDFYTEIKG